MARVLVVDDERSMREMLTILLEEDGHDVTTAGDVGSALQACRGDCPELVFTDLKLPDGTGMEVLTWLTKNAPETQVIMMTAYATAETAVEAMRSGAYDYQVKPVKVAEIRALTNKALEKASLIRENRRMSAQLRGRFGLSGFVGQSPRIGEVIDLIERVAPTRTNVLVEGESGTGKELVARAVHDGSPRAKKAFVAVNCGAIPESLIEAELFGHVAGAFTGANKRRRGLFDAAHGGSLLLDEISELPAQMQVKLLRVIQERTIRPVGADREHTVDVRLIAATNRDLQQRVKVGAFREDLFYRLNVVRIRVPPLRERTEDIPLLAREFVRTYASQSQKEVDSISDEALRALTAFSFPGNVRELQNFVERAVALCERSTIGLDDLPEEVRRSNHDSSQDLLSFPEGGIPLEDRLHTIEKRFIAEALERSDGVKKRAAAMLGLSFRSFRYRLKKLDMSGPQAADSDEL